MKVFKHWNNLHKKVVVVPFLQVFKAKLDGALDNVIFWKVFSSQSSGIGTR